MRQPQEIVGGAVEPLGLGLVAEGKAVDLNEPLGRLVIVEVALAVSRQAEIVE